MKQFTKSFLTNPGAAQRCVKKANALMQGTRKGQQHEFSRSAYSHALLWQKGVADGKPLAQLARSYQMFRAALAMAQDKVWRAARRVARAMRETQAPVHWRHEHTPLRGQGMQRAMVPYRYAVASDGRSTLQRAGKVVVY